MHVERMCSNALAMIKNMTDTDIAIQRMKMQNRKLKEEDDNVDESIKWPEWLSAGDRRLLQSSSLTPNVVVAADGSVDESIELIIIWIKSQNLLSVPHATIII